MNILINAAIGLIVVSFIYWAIQKIAEWIDDRRISRMKPSDFSGIGTKKDGSGVFDEKGM